jgi:release factor glutamine methyltransferase
MFVADNRVASAKQYFFEALADLFSNSECKLMWSSLLNAYFGWSSSDVLLNNNQRFSESDLLRIRSVVKRLQANEPFQYIMGEVYFADLNLKIDQRALIPRPETEELIDLILKLDLPFGSILDLCTGSGCIALALQNKFPNAKVVGVDLSFDAIALARENALHTKLDVEFVTENILTWQAAQTFDLLVSNPPYIPQQEAQLMAANVLDFEPHMALFVPDHNPLLFYKRIVAIAHASLQSKGYLALEIHEDLAAQTLALLQTDAFQNPRIYRDLQGKERMILAQKA